jgi:excisionase family DNA binding protein
MERANRVRTGRAVREKSAAPQTPIVISIPEAAVLAGISRQSAYEAARRGEIPTVRIGRRILVPRSRLLRLLNGEH